MISNKHERGQAIIIIAFAIVALIGFAALAVDGGRVLSDRRHAQNAADTAAYAAALAKVKGGNYTDAAQFRASSNGYDNNGDTNIVEVHLCNESGITCLLPTGADASEYIQVKITSHVQTFFARILGRDRLTNVVQAVAKATMPKTTRWFDGKALVSAMDGCKGDNGAPNNPFTVGGNGTTIVNNSGIFVNSACSVAFVDNGNSNLVTTSQGTCVVGGIQSGVNGVEPPPVGHCGAQININDYVLPSPEEDGYCNQAGSITEFGGEYEAWPGYFNKTGNQTFPDVSPSGVLKLHKGVYCLYNGISLNANWEITTDLNGNDVHDSASEGVFFYVPDGDITFNGGSALNVHAIDSSDYPSTIQKYLFYVPLSNDANITITGNSGSIYTGTVLAPASHCTLDGSGNTFSLDTQLICYDTTITGAGYIDITHTDANNAVTTTKPTIKMEQ
ncbi:MAG: pilus assembly protein TadG-related protein [Anaerolineales bacterium]